VECLFLFGPYDGETVDVEPRMVYYTVIPDQVFDVVDYCVDAEIVTQRRTEHTVYERRELYDGSRHFVYVPIDCKESVLGRLIELATSKD